MATYQKRAGKWRALIRRKGFPVQSQTFIKKSDAEEWARHAERQMDVGMPISSTNKNTVAQVFERYAKEVSPTKKGARWEQIRIARLVRTAGFMHKLLNKVTPQDLQQWRDLRCTEISGESVNRELNLISGVFTHAIKEWHAPMAINPVRLVKRPPRSKPRNRRVSKEELAKLWATTEGPRNRPMQIRDWVPLVFELGVETGMRLGELLELRGEGVNLEESWVHVRKSKNGEERYVPLTPRAKELLVVTGESNSKLRLIPVNVGSFGATFRKMIKKLGLSNLHFHDSRHEATTRLSKKFTLLELSRVTGHKDLKSLKVYFNPTPQELVAKLNGGQ